MKVLVIGAASGLGKAVVAQAAARGDRVCTIDVDDPAVGNVDGVVASIACDISDASSIEKALDLLEREGPFHLVVISAGISATGPFEAIDPALMSRVISVNLTGTMMVTAALLKRSMIARAGRLVLVSSLSHFVSYPGASAYAASKEGVVVFARSLARSCRREREIMVQVVAPGPMDTPHAERHAPRRAKRGHRMDPELVAGIILRNRRSAVIVPGLAGKLIALAGMVAPFFIGKIMRRLIYDRM